jgi:hypothetical protein
MALAITVVTLLAVDRDDKVVTTSFVGEFGTHLIRCYSNHDS